MLITTCVVHSGVILSLSWCSCLAHVTHFWFSSPVAPLEVHLKASLTKPLATATGLQDRGVKEATCRRGLLVKSISLW